MFLRQIKGFKGFRAKYRFLKVPLGGLYGVLAILSAIGLNNYDSSYNSFTIQW